MLELDIQMFADGKVVIETDLNEKGFKNGLNKIKSVAETGFKATATAVGVTATAITGLVAKSVNMAGEIEQQIGGTEAVFGDLADVVQKKAVGAFEKMGVSANDFMATANKMGALMQGSGIDIEESMELSTQAMQRAADVASIMGIDLNSAMESIAGAAKGNFTMMDNLGVAMNATTIEAYALSKGIEESYNQMDNATKIGLAMEMFLEKTAYAEGNYAKENETFAGSFNTLKAAISNFLSGAGGIQDVAKSLVNFSKILVKSIGEMAPTIIDGLAELIETIIPEIPPLLDKLLPVAINGATDIVNKLMSTILDKLPELLQTGITLFLEFIKGITQTLPQLIPQIIQAILIIVDTLLDNIDLIVDCGVDIIFALIEGIFNAIPDLIMKLPEIIIKVSEELLRLIIIKIPEIGKQLVIKLIEGLFSYNEKMISKIKEFFKGTIFEPLINKITDMAQIGINLVKGLWNGISGSYQWIKDKITGWVGNVLGFIKKLFGIASPSKVMRDQVGKYLAQGLGVGFDNELDNVYDDMQRAIDLETSKMTANVQTSGTYQMAMAGLPQFNLLDNTNNTTQLVVNGKVLAEVVNTENRNREVAVG